MSEMVLVVPVIALTAIVLVGILAIFRKLLVERDRLDAEFLEAQKRETTVPKPAANPVVFVQTRRHAA
jgi:hypothetical protein